MHFIILDIKWQRINQSAHEEKCQHLPKLLKANCLETYSKEQETNRNRKRKETWTGVGLIAVVILVALPGKLVIFVRDIYSLSAEENVIMTVSKTSF